MQDDAFKFPETLQTLTTGLVDMTEPRTVMEAQPVLEQEEEIDKLPPILSGREFPKQYELVKRPVQVDGLFRKGDNVLLTAPSKMGKTWFYSTIATCIASGINFCSRPTMKGRVLLIDLELHRDDAIERLWRVAKANQLERPPEDLFLWPLRSCDYTLDTLVEVLAERLIHIGDIDVIILDPIYMLENGQGFDENNASDVKKLMVEMSKLGQRHGATLCLSHHYRKGTMGTEDHIDRGSGSGAFARFPDSLISLSRHQEQGCAIVEVTGRSMPKASPFVIEMAPPSMRIRLDLPPAHKRYASQSHGS